MKSTTSHRDKLIKRLNSDTYLSFIKTQSVKNDTSVNLLSLIDKRVFNGITQEQVSISYGCSLAKIKRFEAGKVDSLSLFLFYVHQFKHLKNKKTRKIPSWVNS